MQTERGISPEILFTHIQNTAPFLFQNKAPITPFTQVVLDNWEKLKISKLKLSHTEYFELCLCAHYTTVATFVPTDVDNQIRKNLWDQKLSDGITEEMAALVLRSYNWDFRPLTTRYAEFENLYVSGHQGEWFSVAVGAYAAHRKKNPALAKEIQNQILKEAHLEAKIFTQLKKKKDGTQLLKACTMIAHNFGDLDRVMDQWDLEPDDPLRASAYKLAHTPHPNFGSEQSSLLEAGALNKSFMASENHRHYPLRKAKCLRKSIQFLLPISPFLHTWGEMISRSPELTKEEVAEIAMALLEGFERLSSPKIPLFGYARAIGGIQAAFPGGPKIFLEYLPSKAAKEIQSIKISQIAQSRDFEAQWAKKALNFLKLM